METVEKHSEHFYIRANRCGSLYDSLLALRGWKREEINGIEYEVNSILTESVPGANPPFFVGTKGTVVTYWDFLKRWQIHFHKDVHRLVFLQKHQHVYRQIFDSVDNFQIGSRQDQRLTDVVRLV